LRSIGCEYAQGYHFGEPIPERAVLQLLKMVRRSESKMQPRGFFRPKFRSIGKQAKAKVARAAIAAPDKSPATGDQKAITAPPKAPAKVAAALPVGSIVRQRHKSVAAKPPVAAAMPAKSAAPPKAAEALRSAVTNGGPPGNPLAPVVPGAMPALPPELLQNIERTSGSAPQAQRKPSGKGHGQSAPKPSAPGPLPTPVADRTASPPGPNIMAPLSEALARASNTPPTTGRPAPAGTSQRNGHAPPPAKEPPPVNAAPPLPTPNESTQQPDFSTLPPSIAASLARLAGGEPPPKTMGGPPSRSEPKVASKG
jgi:hypothetical protein